jgi:hypothetical protein
MNFLVFTSKLPASRKSQGRLFDITAAYLSEEKTSTVFIFQNIAGASPEFRAQHDLRAVNWEELSRQVPTVIGKGNNKKGEIAQTFSSLGVKLLLALLLRLLCHPNSPSRRM